VSLESRGVLPGILLIAAATLPAGSSPKHAPGEPVILLEEAGVKNAYPHWSKDGSRLLFQSNRGGKWHLYEMGADGTGRRQLTQGDWNDTLPDWSPDGRAIAFVSDRSGNEDVWIMSEDGSDARNLSRNPAKDIHPYWSPDGSRILFNSTRDVDRLQIYEMNPDGTEVKRLVTSGDDDSCARVSPKGDRILYLANLAEGRDDVLVRKRDGSQPVNLTDDQPADGWPTWMPDGARIVFASERSGAFALFTAGADGKGARQITFPPSGSFDARPNVSRDGKKIVFNREHGDTIAILRMDLAADR
jgi:Tol biopolymer transport system component